MCIGCWQIEPGKQFDQSGRPPELGRPLHRFLLGRAAKRQRGSLKQRADVDHLAGIGHERRCACFRGDRLGWLAPASCDRDTQSALAGESAREAGAKAGTCPHDPRAPYGTAVTQLAGV